MSEIVTVKNPPSIKVVAPQIQAASSSYTITNSDVTYSQVISNDFELPDITFTDYDGSTSSVPSVKNITATQISTSYAYPILTEQTSFRDGDEGWQLANVWNSVYGDGATARKAIIELSDFYTLKTNNVHGNTSRFTTPAGAAATTLDFNATDEIIEDHYLGIKLIVMDETLVTWNDYIDNAQAITTNGGGWYAVPAIIQAQLIDLNASAGMNDIIIPGSAQWTATTRKDAPNTNRAYRLFFGAGLNIDTQLKTSTQRQNIAYKLL